jgi:hypothetical protein
MKKILFFAALFFIAASSFAYDLPNRRIFIEGAAVRPDQTEYFFFFFFAEAVGTGYPLTVDIEEAAYIFRFDVRSNIDRNIDNNLYVLTISLITIPDNAEVVTVNFYFSSLDEMYEYNRSLFLSAVSYILPYTEDDMIIEVIEVTEIDTAWKDKWLYLRVSFDYPITFYLLRPDGLIGGAGVYDGTFENPVSTAALDHKIYPMPGATAGAELQFLDFMSVELNVKFLLGDTRDNLFLNIAAGTEIKFPLKFFKHFVLAPYIALQTPITISGVFMDFPRFSLGGGIQAGARGGKNASVFVDVNFLFSFTSAGMYNPYGDQLFPYPKVIHYTRYVLGISVGYKFGFINRK